MTVRGHFIHLYYIDFHNLLTDFNHKHWKCETTKHRLLWTWLYRLLCGEHVAGGAALFVCSLPCGETISVVFISGPTIETPSFPTHTHIQSEKSLTRCLQLKAIYCHTANTSICTWPKHTHTQSSEVNPRQYWLCFDSGLVITDLY